MIISSPTLAMPRMNLVRMFDPNAGGGSISLYADVIENIKIGEKIEMYCLTEDPLDFSLLSPDRYDCTPKQMVEHVSGDMWV